MLLKNTVYFSNIQKYQHSSKNQPNLIDNFHILGRHGNNLMLTEENKLQMGVVFLKIPLFTFHPLPYLK